MTETKDAWITDFYRLIEMHEELCDQLRELHVELSKFLVADKPMRDQISKIDEEGSLESPLIL